MASLTAGATGLLLLIALDKPQLGIRPLMSPELEDVDELIAMVDEPPPAASPAAAGVAAAPAPAPAADIDGRRCCTCRSGCRAEFECRRSHVADDSFGNKWDHCDSKGVEDARPLTWPEIGHALQKTKNRCPTRC